MALKKQPFEKSLPPFKKHLFHPPFQRQRKRKNIPSHYRNHYFGKGVRKIVLERGSSFGREEIKYLIFLLPLLKFSLHYPIPLHPTPFNFRQEKT
jgi:hypothetical protein